MRGIEGKVGALRWAREQLVPTLGICLGLQCMVIEYARTVAGIDGASSTEFDPGTPAPVIATMEEQKAFVDGAGDLGGTMRLGSQRALLVEGSVVATAYGSTTADERHRHRYEVNESYREALEEAGLVISGIHPDLGLVEFVELPVEVHPYFVATQAHPEFKSRPTRAHPLFAGLIGAAIEAQRAASRLVEVERPRHHEHRRGACLSRCATGSTRGRCSRPCGRFDGRVWDVVSEEVDLGEAGVVTATSSTTPVRSPCWRSTRRSASCSCSSTGTRSARSSGSCPRGCSTSTASQAHLTAARELLEEADLAAGEWHLLLDHYASPGGSSEALRVFLARDLHAVPDGDRHERDGEELGMPVRRVPLDEVVAAALAGDVHNGTLMIAVLAASGCATAGGRAAAGGRAVAHAAGARAMRGGLVRGRERGERVGPGPDRAGGGLPVRRSAAWRVARRMLRAGASWGSGSPTTAEALMRSRYTAYALGDGDHLFRTWHARTRTDDATPDPRVRWDGSGGARRRGRRRRGRRGGRGVPWRGGSAPTTGRCAEGSCTSGAGSRGGPAAGSTSRPRSRPRHPATVVRVMEAHRTSAWRGDYEVKEGDRSVATFARSSCAAAGCCTSTGGPTRCGPTPGRPRTRWSTTEGVLVASAARVGRKDWTVESGGTTHQFRRPSLWRSEEQLQVGGQPTGFDPAHQHCGRATPPPTCPECRPWSRSSRSRSCSPPGTSRRPPRDRAATGRTRSTASGAPARRSAPG